MTDGQNKFDANWSEATLNDAADALEDLIASIKEHPDEVKELLIEKMPDVYAKLNYAYHSAEDADESLINLDEDEIISFPPIFPLSHLPLLRSEESDSDKDT